MSSTNPSRPSTLAGPTSHARRRSTSASSSSSSGSGSSPSPSPGSCSRSPSPFTPDPAALAALDARLRTAFSPAALALCATGVSSVAGPSAASHAANDGTGTGASGAGAPDDDDDGAAEAALGRPLTKAEKQNAKKRRRRERERAVRAEVEAAVARAEGQGAAAPAETRVVPFRLLAGRETVDLAVSDDYATTANPRLAPLPPGLAARIRRLAAEASEGAAAVSAAVARPGEPVCGAVTVAVEPPPVMLVTSTSGADRVRAVRAVPVVSADPARMAQQDAAAAPAAARPSKSAARRQRKRQVPRPVARFWAPPVSLGGKSAGYAMGWRDSAAGRREGGFAGYVRSAAA